MDNSNIIQETHYNNHVDILNNYDILKKNNTTPPIMTLFEKTKIIGLRSQQIANGAPILVEIDKYIDNIIDIAEYELKQKKTPYILKRKVNDTYEYWKIEDLIIN